MRTHARKRASLQPPVEPLVVPAGASEAQVWAAAQAALRDLYIMMQRFEVSCNPCWVVSVALACASCPRAGDAVKSVTVLERFQVRPPPSCALASLQAMPCL